MIDLSQTDLLLELKEEQRQAAIAEHANAIFHAYTRRVSFQLTLSHPQVLAIRSLASNPDIAYGLSSFFRTMASLVDKGLVCKRYIKPDKPHVEWKLTEAGWCVAQLLEIGVIDNGDTT